MLIEFDQNTLANMTAALESVCRKLPPGKDSPQLRKQIADAMVARAKAGRRSYADFESAGAEALGESAMPDRSRWLSWLKRG
jgi:hypothetical protein